LLCVVTALDVANKKYISISGHEIQFLKHNLMFAITSSIHAFYFQTQRERDEVLKSYFCKILTKKKSKAMFVVSLGIGYHFMMHYDYKFKQKKFK
jgi:hypothetical protein